MSVSSPPSRKRPTRLLPLWEGRAVLIVTGLCLTSLTALFLFFQPLLIQQAELRLYDLMLSGRTTPPQSNVPVLVGIDEESLGAYGQWPWPRYRLGRLVERLHGLGAKVVALDFLMPENDRTAPEVIISERRRDQELAPIPPANGQKDSNSQRLAEAMLKGNTALGYFFDFTGRDALPALPAPAVPVGMIVTRVGGSDAAWPKPTAMIRSIPDLTRAASAEGFTNARHDRDGALRRVPLLLPYDGELYPSLALSALLLSSNDRTLRLSRDAAETTLNWGNRRIPLDHEGHLLLDFRDQQHPFPYHSAKSVLAGTLSPGSLHGKVVLVGPWAKGLGDYHLTPSGQSVSGLTVHATVIDNILANTFINRPGWARGAELFAVLLLGLLSSWLLSRSGFLLSLLTVTAGTAGCYAGCRLLMVSKGLYISPLLPMLTSIIVMTILSLLKYGIEARKVRHRTRALIEAQDTIIISMSSLTEARDKETGGHILRTQRYVEILARQLSTMPNFKDLDETSIELLTKSAPLHDIGKVGIPDSILQKAGNLTEQEYAIMKSHTVIGAQALTRTIDSTAHPEHLDFLHYAQQMIESHHEHWDGSGYPYGLRGDEIPLAGRLMALADVYDAMISRRVYKEEIPHEKAREFILKNSGIQFDPDVVAAFIARNEDFQRIALECVDGADAKHAS